MMTRAQIRIEEDEMVDFKEEGELEISSE